MRGRLRLTSDDVPEKHHIQLCHYKQKSNWDCGVSCVLMVLPNKYRQHLVKNLSRICKSEGFHKRYVALWRETGSANRKEGNGRPKVRTAQKVEDIIQDMRDWHYILSKIQLLESDMIQKITWTIDLCYLLKRYEIDHIFYTITIGVHEGFRGHSFYHHILTKDETRVNLKFKEAPKNNILVEKNSVSILLILEHLLNGPVIILTNARLLCCDICKFNKISSELRKCLPWSTPYQGHYIVICGYDIGTQKVFYRNPSFGDHVCVMPISNLEEARKSYGTDEDIIFIYK